MLCAIKKFSLLIFCLILLLLTGCWNNRNLTDLGIVVGVGLDKASDNQVEITVQLLNPNIMESRKQGSMEKATNTISAKGKTAFEANRNLLAKINKKLFYSHIQLLVIGEKLARKGIGDMLDFFQRVHEIDKRELILIAKGITAKEVFEVEPVQSDIPTMEIIETIKNTERLATLRRVTLIDVISNTVSGGNSVIGKVEGPVVNQKLKMTDLIFTGAAVLKKDKLIGWLNPIETYGFLITDNKFMNPILTVPSPISHGENITVEIDNSKTKKNVYFKSNELVLSVEVHTFGKMVEQHGNGDLTSVEQIKAVETVVSQQMKKIISDVIREAQKKYHLDIFNFRDIVHKKHLSYWRKVKNNWDDVFENLPISVKVQFKNLNAGFIKANK